MLLSAAFEDESRSSRPKPIKKRRCATRLDEKRADGVENRSCEPPDPGLAALPSFSNHWGFPRREHVSHGASAEWVACPLVHEEGPSLNPEQYRVLAKCRTRICCYSKATQRCSMLLSAGPEAHGRTESVTELVRLLSGQLLAGFCAHSVLQSSLNDERRPLNGRRQTPLD